MSKIEIRNLNYFQDFGEQALNASEQNKVVGGQINAPGIGDIGGLKQIAENPEAVALLKAFRDTGNDEAFSAMIQTALRYDDVIIQSGQATGNGNTGINIA